MKLKYDFLNWSVFLAIEWDSVILTFFNQFFQYTVSFDRDIENKISGLLFPMMK